MFEISDPDQYLKLKKVIRQADNFDAINEKAGNRALQYSLDYYEEFLRNPEAEEQEKALNTNRSDGPQLDKNIILYGPPGTGKTYYTVLYSVAIIEKKPVQHILEEAKQYGYESVKVRYENYQTSGQIAFTTFHQSYGYEEFMEGIKPVMGGSEAASNSKEITYEVADGIFKHFCDTAKEPLVQSGNDYGLGEHPVIWKVSLGGSGDHAIKKDCFEHGRIRIGWDTYGEIVDESTSYTEGGQGILGAFINDMQKGDIVLVLRDRETIDGIGVVTGDYEWLESFDEYKRSRSVKWLATNIRENILKLNGGTGLTLGSVYRLHRMTLEDVLSILQKHRGNEAASVARQNDQNYVFIIDEVNRGNISKIFGELITLIEPSKRLGMSEEIKLRLPYSGDVFGVPNNVYLLATMNTADRSIARLDTALRRRFSFAEMMPDPKVLSDLKITGTDLNLQEMLKIMNRRIEALYDREHKLGHAYFLSLHKEPTLTKLGHLFEHTIIPLLQEYFYEDYEKIRLVLGDPDKPKEEQFIMEEPIDAKGLFGSKGAAYAEERVVYTTNHAAFEKEGAYRKIYAFNSSRSEEETE